MKLCDPLDQDVEIPHLIIINHLKTLISIKSKYQLIKTTKNETQKRKKIKQKLQRKPREKLDESNLIKNVKREKKVSTTPFVMTKMGSQKRRVVN